MSFIKNKALILALALGHAYSSTALDVSTPLPTSLGSGSKKANVNKNNNVVADKYPKAMKFEQEKSHANIYKGFNPFVAKKITVVFEHSEVDVPGVAEFASSKITSKELHEIRNRVIDYFIEHDYLIPQVHFDQKEIKSGVLKINVHADSIHHVVIFGPGENNSLMQEYASIITSSGPAKRSLVQRYLGLMNKIPGFEISYKLDENKSHHTELLIETIQNKVAVFTGADNYGDKDIGKYQFNALAEVYNPFSSRDAIILHGATSDHPKRLSDVGIAYKNIFNSHGTTVNLFAAHTSDNPYKASSADNTNKGKGYNLRGAITHPIFLSARHDLEFEIGAHYHNLKSKILENHLSEDYKNSKYTKGDIGLTYHCKDDLEAKNILKTSLYLQLKRKI